MPFSRIVGHERIIALLKRSLAAGRISHAYLFHGVDESGMKGAALSLIEAEFCGRAEGCGECPSCRKIGRLQHPDLHLLEPDGAFIKIDQIRELQKELSFRPYEAPKKACIIEDADRMNPAAANAFLKTLEEPPGNALLILLTSHVESVLPTILSRCQQLRFPPLPTETIVAHLKESGTEDEPARIAAALAGGNLEKARSILDEDCLQARQVLLERLSSLTGTGISPLFAMAEEYARDKDSALDLVNMLTLFWRDILLVEAGCREITNRDLFPLVNKTAEQHTLEQIMTKLDCISRAGHALTRNVNPRLAAEVLFMELAGCPR